ncbi:hypothetical protein N9384_00575 [bacterium]|nr:hypothetical protein [bacterium]
MSVTIVYQTTCRCYESFEASIMQSLAFIAGFLLLQALQQKPRVLPCQANMMKQSGSSKPCKSAAVLQVQDQASFYMIAVFVIGA